MSASDPGEPDRPATLVWSDTLSRSLLESAPDPMLITDERGLVKLSNSAAERLFGYGRGELDGQPVEALMPARHKRAHARHRLSFAEHPRVRPMHSGIELWSRRRDGTELAVEISLSPLRTDAGVLTVAAIRDMTQRKRAEEAVHELHARSLQDSEARYQQILETTPDGVWRVDANNITDYVNRRMTEIIGYTESEMIGQPLSRFMGERWVALAESAISRDRSAHTVTVFEARLRHKDGSEVWCRISGSPLFDGDGAPTGSIAVMSDITLAKQREADLRATERLLVAATDGMTDGMVAIDSEGRVTLMNRAAEEMLGWSESELHGRVAHDMVHLQHENGSPYPIEQCPMTQVRTGGESIAIEDDVFIRRDGEQLPVAYTAAPLVGKGTEGSVIVFRDISAHKLQERRRAEELDQLSWVGRIRDALENDRFVLYAQPIVEITTREVVSHELLIRMIGEDGAVIAPGRFLPAAERFDLIQRIDLWVAGQAIDLAAKGFSVQFNVSGRSVGDAELIATITSQLEATGADPSLLLCEITETAMAHDTALAGAFVRQLSALGCRVALDDFGTGYGGFTYLKQLPADYIKIDIAFIHDLEDNRESRHVVAAIVSLAKAFGQRTIAEGVERLSTLGLLAELGVDHAQGYCVGRPEPAETVLC